MACGSAWGLDADRRRKLLIRLAKGGHGAHRSTTLAILGHQDRLAGLLESDPIGADFEDVHGRRRAGSRADVANF